MNATRSTASLALLLALASGPAAASATRPPPLGFSPPAPRPANMDMQRPAQAWRNPPQTFRSAPPRAPDAAERTRKLRQRALQSVLDSTPDPALDEDKAEGRMQLHFQRRDSGLRDLNKSYRELCNRVSSKIWDEPNGKRVRFDIAGKPGFGVEIPLGRAKR